MLRSLVAVRGRTAQIVEVHPAPEKAFSDGSQSLDIPQFAKMMQELEPYVELWKAMRGSAMAAKALGSPLGLHRKAL